MVSHNGDGTRLLVVLSGTVVEQNFDTNAARSLAVLDPLGAYKHVISHDTVVLDVLLHVPFLF